MLAALRFAQGPGTSERLIVVGNGMASARLCEQLVARGYDGRVTVLGDEQAPAYNRILLSAVLEGTHPLDALTLRDPAVVRRSRHRAAYRHPGPSRRPGRGGGRARRRPPARFRPAGAGHRVDPDAAADPRPGADGRLAAPEGARVPVARRLPPAARCGARGDGAPSWSVAACSASRWPGRCRCAASPPRSSRAPSTCCRARSTPAAERSSGAGCGSSAPRSTPAARAVRLTDEGLRLDNGFTLDTDLVVLAAGGRPSTALARQAGLSCRRGVVVGRHLASVTDERIHAIGDCAEHARTDHRLRAPGVGAGRRAGRPPRRRRTRRTTARAASPGCAPPAWTSPSSATPSAPTARSSRSPTRSPGRTASWWSAAA